MKEFFLSPAARIDLAGIWDYTVKRWGVEQAERYIRELTDACQALTDERLSGRAIDDVRAGYFKLSVGSHFLCYRFTGIGTIEIIRILHQRMDIPERLA
ncbi:MAG: type II toxin-antitoxin system RelE/ParE family toxin [Acidobacteriota bacterium]